MALWWGVSPDAASRLRSTRQASELAFAASSVWIDTTSPYTTPSRCLRGRHRRSDRDCGAVYCCHHRPADQTLALVFRKSPVISSVTPSTFNIIANSEPADYTITSGSAVAATLILSAAATRTSGSIPTHSLGGGGVRLIDDDSLSLVYAIQNTSHSDLLAAETESASVGAVFINGYLEAA
jgi:hypothetical protein